MLLYLEVYGHSSQGIYATHYLYYVDHFAAKLNFQVFKSDLDKIF